MYYTFIWNGKVQNEFSFQVNILHVFYFPSFTLALPSSMLRKIFRYEIWFMLSFTMEICGSLLFIASGLGIHLDFIYLFIYLTLGIPSIL